jgi:uncharacterized protein
MNSQTTVLEPALAWREDFVPRRGFRNGHMQTLAGNFLRRPPFLLEAEASLVEVDSQTGSQVLCHCHWQPKEVRNDRLTVILVHGLEGSSMSQYVLGNTVRAWAAGCNVVRMNMRNCGGTDQLSPTLYHSAFSGDVGAVMEHFQRVHGLERIALVGYSMGGNLVLKLAGELGEKAPSFLKAVVGVSPAVDLAASADALHEPRNRVYEWHFLRGLMRRFERKTKLFPQIYSTQGIGPIRSLREFDDRITARYSGFEGADDYYDRAASARVVGEISVPTLVLHALDDPFIRLLPETHTTLHQNAAVHLIETAYGGHCAFLSAVPGPDGYWAEKVLLGFLLSVTGG